VDWFGKNRLNVEAANAQINAAEENFHSVHAALAAEIATAYTNLRADETRLEVLQEILKTREQTARLASWRQQAGEADSLESTQALSSLEQARAGIPALKQSIAQGKNLLALLVGRPPGSLDAVLNSGKSAIPHPDRGLAIGIPADTIRQRPDVRLAGWQLVAAVATTRSADARTPAFAQPLGKPRRQRPQRRQALQSGNRQRESDRRPQRPDLRRRPHPRQHRGLGESRGAGHRTYRSAVLTALSEVEDALIACRRSAERLAILEEATRLAREADELARQRYEAGEIDFLEVLDSQRTLLGLEDSLLATRTDRTVAYIRLYQALGGGWSPLRDFQRPRHVES
jgi:outer membrane protein, multidrug efflux system